MILSYAGPLSPGLHGGGLPAGGALLQWDWALAPCPNAHCGLAPVLRVGASQDQLPRRSESRCS